MEEYSVTLAIASVMTLLFYVGYTLFNAQE